MPRLEPLSAKTFSLGFLREGRSSRLSAPPRSVGALSVRFSRHFFRPCPLLVGRRYTFPTMKPFVSGGVCHGFRSSLFFLLHLSDPLVKRILYSSCTLSSLSPL